MTQYKFSKSVFGKDAILKTVYLWPNVLISEDEFNYVIEVNSPDNLILINLIQIFRNSSSEKILTANSEN